MNDPIAFFLVVGSIQLIVILMVVAGLVGADKRRDRKRKAEEERQRNERAEAWIG